jgi:hypothetical protein
MKLYLTDRNPEAPTDRPTLYLTDEHANSSYGCPVMCSEYPPDAGRVWGPEDGGFLKSREFVRNWISQNTEWLTVEETNFALRFIN